MDDGRWMMDDAWYDPDLEKECICVLVLKNSRFGWYDYECDAIGVYVSRRKTIAKRLL